MSNRIAVFNDGRIQQLAPPTELYEKPINSFVAQFIGENNKLTGTVLSTQDGLCDVKLPTGEVVTALDINTDAVGSESTLSLRPERVFLNPSNGHCNNVFRGQVEEVIYLGDHVRVRMNVCGHDDFIVKVPNASDKQALKVGETVPVGWSSDDCRALDAA